VLDKFDWKKDSRSMDDIIDSIKSVGDDKKVPTVCFIPAVPTTKISPAINVLIISNCSKMSDIACTPGAKDIATSIVVESLKKILFQNDTLSFLNAGNSCGQLYNESSFQENHNSRFCCSEFKGMHTLNAKMISLKMEHLKHRFLGDKDFGIIVTAGLSKAFEAFRLLVVEVLASIDIDATTSVSIAKLVDGTFKVWVSTNHVTNLMGKEDGDSMGSLVFAIEFAKKLCYKEDSWDGRISNFSILLFRYLLFINR
jgi:hypothetical protein